MGLVEPYWLFRPMMADCGGTDLLHDQCFVSIPLCLNFICPTVLLDDIAPLGREGLGPRALCWPCFVSWKSSDIPDAMLKKALADFPIEPIEDSTRIGERCLS